MSDRLKALMSAPVTAARTDIMALENGELAALADWMDIRRRTMGVALPLRVSEPDVREATPLERAIALQRIAALHPEGNLRADQFVQQAIELGNSNQPADPDFWAEVAGSARRFAEVCDRIVAGLTANAEEHEDTESK